MHHISKYSLLLSSFLFCGIGFILFVNPIEKIATFSWLISLGFFLISVSRLSRYYRLRTQATLSDPYLFQSVVSLVFAVYLLLYGYKTLPIVFPITLGIWLLYKSALSLKKAHYLSKRSEELSKKFTFWGDVYKRQVEDDLEKATGKDEHKSRKGLSRWLRGLGFKKGE